MNLSTDETMGRMKYHLAPVGHCALLKWYLRVCVCVCVCVCMYVCVCVCVCVCV